MGDFSRVDELRHLRLFPQKSIDEGSFPGRVRTDEADEAGPNHSKSKKGIWLIRQIGPESRIIDIGL